MNANAFATTLTRTNWLCDSDISFGDCQDSYRTYCKSEFGEELMCETVVDHCNVDLDGDGYADPCIAFQEGEHCDNFGQDLGLKACRFPFVSPLDEHPQHRSH